MSTAEVTATLFAALGDPTRLSLLSALAEGPAATGALAARTPLTRQAVSKHLVVLEQAGLARSAKSGRERRWELVPGRLRDARRLLDAMEQQWDSALGRLADYLDESEQQPQP